MALMTGITFLAWVNWINVTAVFAATPEFPQGTYYYVSTPLSGSSKTVVNTDGNTVGMIGFHFLLCYHGEAR